MADAAVVKVCHVERAVSAEAEVDGVRCPIGISQASKDPAAIALSTATELIEVMEARAATPATTRAVAR